MSSNWVYDATPSLNTQTLTLLVTGFSDMLYVFDQLHSTYWSCPTFSYKEHTHNFSLVELIIRELPGKRSWTLQSQELPAYVSWTI